MRNFFKTTMVAAALLATCITPAVQAQIPAGAAPGANGQYGYIALGGYDWTGSGTSYTIPASAATNIMAITNGAARPAWVISTKFDEFNLQLAWKPHTQPSATGPLSVRWFRSDDGTNWPTIGVGGTNSSTGWFIACAVDLTNATTVRAAFQTNIPMGSAGYWGCIITNGTDSVLTNVDVKVYVKPKRTG